MLLLGCDKAENKRENYARDSKQQIHKHTHNYPCIKVEVIIILKNNNNRKTERHLVKDSVKLMDNNIAKRS